MGFPDSEFHPALVHFSVALFVGALLMEAAFFSLRKNLFTATPSIFMCWPVPALSCDMNIKIFSILFFFLFIDMPWPRLLETSAARAEEVVQLARLRPRMKFVRNDRLREQLRANKRKELVQKVFISPRGSPGRPPRR